MLKVCLAALKILVAMFFLRILLKNLLSPSSDELRWSIYYNHKHSLNNTANMLTLQGQIIFRDC